MAISCLRKLRGVRSISIHMERRSALYVLSYFQVAPTILFSKRFRNHYLHMSPIHRQC